MNTTQIMFANRLIVFACVLACYARVLPAMGAENRNNIESYQSSGDPGVVLTRLPDGATQIGSSPNIEGRLRGNELFFTSDSYLVKIGDVYVKGQSIERLTKLLPGPVDSKLQITFIQGDRAVTKDLNRYARSALNERVRNFGSLLNVSDLFAGWHGSNKDFCSLGKTHSATGNNFVAAPFFIAALKRPGSHLWRFVCRTSKGKWEK